jgi:S1-C subfamily serine protease
MKGKGLGWHDWSMKLMLLALMLACAYIPHASAQITSNVFRRVLMIRPAGSDSFGTAFTLEVDGRQYLITAKHVIEGLKAEGTVELRQGETWSPVHVTVFRCDDPIDIAVLVPPKQLTVTYELEPTMKRIVYGQDVYFAGFPYGLFTSGQNVNAGLPLAFIKKAVISATTSDRGAVVMFLDGHNNPGFSGSPIVYRDLGQNRITFKLAGVVSGFRFDRNAVLTPEEIKPEEVKPEDVARGRIMRRYDRLFRLHETDELVDFNTGIVTG